MRKTSQWHIKHFTNLKLKLILLQALKLQSDVRVLSSAVRYQRRTKSVVFINFLGKRQCLPPLNEIILGILFLSIRQCLPPLNEITSGKLFCHLNDNIFSICYLSFTHVSHGKGCHNKIMILNYDDFCS